MFPPCRWAATLRLGRVFVVAGHGGCRPASARLRRGDRGGSALDSLTVDGRDVTAGGSGGRPLRAYMPSGPLANGSHSVSARAGDRSGNLSEPLTWSFKVRDETRP